MKKILQIGLIWVFVCSLLSATTVQADALSRVLESGKLRVGIALFEPWAIKNKVGKLDGFEVQVAKQLARDMGVEPEFIVVDWEQLIKSLENDKFDVIIAGMAITSKRALRVNFSNPYSSSGIGIVANLEKTQDMDSLGELNLPKAVIGAVSGTVSEKIANKVFYRAQVKTFLHDKDAVQAILQGDIHALVASYPEPKFLELQYPKKVDVPLSKPLLNYKTGMVVNKNEQEFLNFLNAWITEKETDGWLKTKNDYWFNSLQWKED